ncbi:MAG: dihydrofolate reductase [Leptospiraceae bacterium]|nr:dihydrofolate reductase [Leptospiraceae bacterium]MBP9164620.1 dihydrofolate reductase [Leptospiraceae bacterium]
MKFSVFMATSLDGYIAKKNGDINWLMEAGNPDDPEDYGYAKFISTIDCIIMGRNTYEKVLSFPEWPYEKQVIVLSKTLRDTPEKIQSRVELFNGSVDELVVRLTNSNHSHIYVDGGKTIQSFLEKGYISDLTLTRIPILLGDGLPLFGALPKELKLRHIVTKSFPSGFVQSTYEI